MRAHLKSNWKGVAQEYKREYWSRARKDVLEALEYLALYAEKMPEDQLKQVFTEETIQSFLKALVHPEVGVWSPSLSKIKDKTERERIEKEWIARQKRIVRICKCLMHELAAVSYYLAPTAYLVLTHGDTDGDIGQLRALQIGY
jgi:hypothetical protein